MYHQSKVKVEGKKNTTQTGREAHIEINQGNDKLLHLPEIDIHIELIIISSHGHSML